MNKTALVTGSSRGIGAAMARRLHRDGWTVLIHYNHSEAQALALAAELGTCAFRADMANATEVEAMMEAAGALDLLVCNAGICDYGLLQELSPARWQELFAVNVEGAYRCCRAAIPAMVRQQGGNILLMSSVWGRYGASCEAAYSASKGALIALGKALAKELGPSGIRVNTIAPGVIETDMLAQFDFADRQALAEETPLGRLGKPEDVAALAAFLASDEASFITAQVIGCDGGFGA